MFTINVTVARDALSSYFLCSNDSNGVLMGRKLTGGLGMRGILVIENCVCDGAAGPQFRFLVGKHEGWGGRRISWRARRMVLL